MDKGGMERSEGDAMEKGLGSGIPWRREGYLTSAVHVAKADPFDGAQAFLEVNFMKDAHAAPTEGPRWRQPHRGHQRVCKLLPPVSVKPVREWGSAAHLTGSWYGHTQVHQSVCSQAQHDALEYTTLCCREFAAVCCQSVCKSALSECATVCK